MSSILIITRHFTPDAAALSYRLQHAAQVLSSHNRVVVLASQPSRYQGQEPAPSREQRDGYVVHRVWNGQVTKSRGKLGRAISEFLGAVWISCIAAVHHRSADQVLVSSPPLSYLLPGLLLRIVFRKRLVVDVRDLWLDWAEESGTVTSGLLLRMLRRFERSVVRNASVITVATKSFAECLQDRYGDSPKPCVVIYNGLDEAIQPAPVSTGKPNADEPVRIVYAGNLGPSQNILGIASGLSRVTQRSKRVEIVIVGDGLQFWALKELESSRLRIEGRVPRETINDIYGSADLFLLHLANLQVYKHTVPSKIFEYAAYGIPVLCGVQGEAREICSRYSDCYYFDSDSSESLVQAIEKVLAGDSPDNVGGERGNPSELRRAARSELWLEAFDVKGAAEASDLRFRQDDRVEGQLQDVRGYRGG